MERGPEVGAGKEEMKLFLTGIAVSLADLLLIGISGYLAIHDKYGWGWFLVAGLICARVASGDCDCKKD